MLRIGYDAKRVFNNFSGLGNYSRALLYDLVRWFPENEYYLYSPSIQNNTDTAFFLDKGRIKTRTCPHPFKSYWRSSGMVKDLLKDGTQIFHGLSHEIPKGLRQKNIKGIVTIHDLIFKQHPEWYPMADRKIYDLKCRYACRNADHIIAISDNTKEDILYHYAIDPQKISVIPPTISLSFRQPASSKKVEKVKAHFQLPKNFMLYVGNLTERKGLQELIQAFALLPKDSRIPLVIVGRGKRYKQKLVARIQQLKVQSEIIFCEDINNHSLPAFYQAAKIFVYPSRYEGFGLPIVESLQMGTAVISTHASAIPQTAGPGALLAHPRSAESLAECLQKLLDDSSLRQMLVDKGRAYYKEQFEPQVLSRQLNGLYQEILGL